MTSACGHLYLNFQYGVVIVFFESQFSFCQIPVAWIKMRHTSGLVMLRLFTAKTCTVYHQPQIIIIIAIIIIAVFLWQLYISTSVTVIIDFEIDPFIFILLISKQRCQGVGWLYCLTLLVSSRYRNPVVSSLESVS